MRAYYTPAMAGADTGVDTTRKSALVAQSLLDDPLPGVEVADISKADRDAAEILIMASHDLNYVRAVATGDPRPLAESSTLGWTPETYPMAVAHCAAVLSAVYDALEGRNAAALASGIHHARHCEGAGYCTFNAFGAIGAWLTTNLPDARLVIVDLDAHFGGGTHEMIERMHNVSQVDVSTNDYDRYSSPYAWKATPGGYLPVVRKAVAQALSRHPDLVIYNAGVDPFDDGVAAAELAERDAYVAHAFSLAEVPVATVLAGGYTSERLTGEALTDMHRATLRAFADDRVLG